MRLYFEPFIGLWRWLTREVYTQRTDPSSGLFSGASSLARWRARLAALPLNRKRTAAPESAGPLIVLSEVAVHEVRPFVSDGEGRR